MLELEVIPEHGLSSETIEFLLGELNSTILKQEKHNSIDYLI